jgi:hypothetical protein
MILISVVRLEYFTKDSAHDMFNLGTNPTSIDRNGEEKEIKTLLF